MVQAHFTLVAKTASVRNAFSTMGLNFRMVCKSQGDVSRPPHTHGRNRNRIALHVILNDRRNCTRRSWQSLLPTQYGIQNRA